MGNTNKQTNKPLKQHNKHIIKQRTHKRAHNIKQHKTNHIYTMKRTTYKTQDEKHHKQTYTYTKHSKQYTKQNHTHLHRYKTRNNTTSTTDNKHDIETHTNT